MLETMLMATPSQNRRMKGLLHAHAVSHGLLRVQAMVWVPFLQRYLMPVILDRATSKEARAALLVIVHTAWPECPETNTLFFDMHGRDGDKQLRAETVGRVVVWGPPAVRTVLGGSTHVHRVLVFRGGEGGAGIRACAVSLGSCLCVSKHVLSSF